MAVNKHTKRNWASKQACVLLGRPTLAGTIREEQVDEALEVTPVDRAFCPVLVTNAASCTWKLMLLLKNPLLSLSA